MIFQPDIRHACPLYSTVYLFVLQFLNFENRNITCDFNVTQREEMLLFADYKVTSVTVSYIMKFEVHYIEKENQVLYQTASVLRISAGCVVHFYISRNLLDLGTIFRNI